MRILAIVVLAIIFLGLVGYAFSAQGSIAKVVLGAASLLGLAHQGIEGNATIWFWGTSYCYAATADVGPSLNVTSAYGSTVQYPLNWNYRPDCKNTASFHIDLYPGRYTLTLSTPMSCQKPEPGAYGGITCDLPFGTVVVPGVYSPTYLYVIGGL
jgi:hypothetical protein